MLSDAAGLLNKMQETQSLLPPSLQGGGATPQPPPAPMLLTPPGVPPHHAISLQGGQPDHLKKSSPHGMPPHSPMGQHQASLRAMHQHISPSVYEMAALTQDLDTQVITTKIKEALLANNIGQKVRDMRVCVSCDSFNLVSWIRNLGMFCEKNMRKSRNEINYLIACC